MVLEMRNQKKHWEPGREDSLLRRGLYRESSVRGSGLGAQATYLYTEMQMKNGTSHDDHSTMLGVGEWQRSLTIQASKQCLNMRNVLVPSEG